MSSQALPVLPASAPFPAEHIQALNAVMARDQPRATPLARGLSRRLPRRDRRRAARGGRGGAARQDPAHDPVRDRIRQCRGRRARMPRRPRPGRASPPSCVDMADVTPADIAGDGNLLVIASTWGEGDPPERAAEFYARAHGRGRAAPRGLRFAVLALGDSSYVNFCEVGRRIDARLEALGAVRIAARIDCDLDYEAPAADWTGRSLEELASAAPEPQAAATAAAARSSMSTSRPRRPPRAWSKANPFAAEITELVNLNGSRSGKQTIHLELARRLGPAFEPGDALGIVSENDPEMVAAVLRAAGLGATRARRAGSARARHHRAVAPGDGGLRQGQPGRRRCASCSPATAGAAGSRAARSSICSRRSLPARARAARRPVAQAAAPALLGRLVARRRTPDEAHLLLGVVRYGSHGRARKGVASTFVAERLRAGDRLKVYVKPNKNFRLPEDPGPADHHDRAGHRRRAVSRLPAGAPGGGRHRAQLAVLRRAQLHPRLPLPARLAGAGEGRRAEPHRRRLLARPAGEGLRPAPAVGAPRRALRLARGRRAPLRLRRREGDGQGRPRDARADRRRPERRARAEAAEAHLAELKRQRRYQRDVY